MLDSDQSDADNPAGQAPPPLPGKNAFTEPPSASPPMDLKPRQETFMFRRVVIGLVGTLLLSSIAVFLLFVAERSLWWSAPVFVVGGVLSFYAAWVAYRKERYEIHDHRVLCHRGGLFGDETTELELRNVTHLKVKLPWLRHKFFGIGHVMVESAGNSQPITMFALREPIEVYDELRQRLRKNGFDLNQRQLLHEESPAMAGIILELLGMIGGFLVMLFLSSSMLVSLLDEIKSTGLSSVLLALFPAALLAVFAFIVVRILDLRRRSYRVYDDVVVYEEGFLTRENAFIPYENIADASTKRTLLDQIFGIFDVQISCQGSGSEIKFRRLKHGLELSTAIDHLITAATDKPKWKPATQEGSAATKSRPQRREPEAMHSGPAISGEFKMNAARVMLPLLLLIPLLPIWIVFMISRGIQLTFTTYSLRSGSLRHQFSFLNINVREFTYGKVTGVIVKRNLWDRLFDTMTVKFWSIGSGEAMEFAHIKRDVLDLAALLRQLGIPPASAEPYETQVKFSLMSWLRARLNFLPPVLIITCAAAIASYQTEPMVFGGYMVALLAVVIISLIHGVMYYPRQTLSFHEHHVEARQGIIAKRHYYACYRNIKRRKTTLYPGGKVGSLEIFVAGEEKSEFIIGQKAKNAEADGLKRQCSFRVGFVTHASEVGNLLDDILCGRVEAGSHARPAGPLEVLIEAPRSVKSAMLRISLLSLLLFPLLVLLPFTLTWFAIAIKRWRYQIDLARIVIRRGVFYRTEESTLLDRVDSLKQNQGPIHKLCGNGHVAIMTAGSSKPDLNIADCPDFRRVYEIIRDHSQ